MSTTAVTEKLSLDSRLVEKIVLMSVPGALILVITPVRFFLCVVVVVVVIMVGGLIRATGFFVVVVVLR